MQKSRLTEADWKRIASMLENTVKPIKDDIQSLKADMKNFKTDINILKDDVKAIKTCLTIKKELSKK